MQNKTTMEQIGRLPLEAIDAETVRHLMTASGDIPADFGDWWYGGEAWDLNIYGAEFDESLTGNQLRAVLYHLDLDEDGCPSVEMYDRPARAFEFEAPFDLPAIEEEI